MSKELMFLRRAVGTFVSRVLVEVLFHGADRYGCLGNVVIQLQDGRIFFLGCAGDGSIFVVTPKKGSIGVPPGFERIDRPLAGVSGLLSDVQSFENLLTLTIGDHQLEVRNEDDELLVTLDHKPLGQEILER